jgi:hypothetical protein
MPTVEELEELLAKTTLRDEPFGQEVERSTMLLRAYLMKNEPQFVQIMEVRHRVSRVNRSIKNSGALIEETNVDTRAGLEREQGARRCILPAAACES